MNEINRDATSAQATKVIHLQPSTTHSASSQIQAYQAANFEDPVLALVDPASLAAKSQSATDEKAANLVLIAQLNKMSDAVAARNVVIDQHVQAEERKAMDDFAKQHGYASWKAMSDKHNPPAKPDDNTTRKPDTAASKHAPKVYKHVLRSDAKNLTEDDEPGYIRLPKDQQESGKYRPATSIETEKFKSDLNAWEAKHCNAKKP